MTYLFENASFGFGRFATLTSALPDISMYYTKKIINPKIGNEMNNGSMD
jgi:hypothetical protein